MIIKSPQNHSHQHTRPIPQLTPPLLREHLARRPRKTRHHIQRRIPNKEIPRPQQQRHRLGRHDGKVLGAGEMDDAEGVPENDVGPGDVLGGVVGDPLGQALGGFAGALGDVPAGGVELGVVVWEEGRGKIVSACR